MTRKKSNPARLGIVMIAVTLLTFVALFSKDRIATTLSSGDTIEVHFARDYKLRPFVSQVKVGFVPVGRVSGVERAADGSAVVSVKVDRDILERLGSAPTATIRPTTLLGGSYFVDLQAGGDPGPFRDDAIPIDRTELPVELDKVTRALQPEALDGLRGTVSHLEGTFDREGTQALERLVSSAPGTMRPLSGVLAAAQGERPNRDLAAVVDGLEATGRVFTGDPARLSRILANLRTTSATLDRRGATVAQTIGSLPTTLDRTHQGLRDLDTSLAALRDVSADLRPVARELRTTLDVLSPVLADARPLVRDARGVVNDARPVLNNLVPSASAGRDVLTDLRGPVLRRVNGPVLEWLHAPYDGSGKYSMTESKKPMYQEITYALVNLDRASSLADKNGHAVGFQPGIGAGSIGGLPISLEQYVKATTNWYYTDEPRNTLPLLEGGAPVNGLLQMLLGGRR